MKKTLIIITIIILLFGTLIFNTVALEPENINIPKNYNNDKSNYWAVIIGSGTLKDAHIFYYNAIQINSLLISNGWNKENIKLLVGPTRNEIQLNINDLGRVVGEKDIVLVYILAHD